MSNNLKKKYFDAVQNRQAILAMGGISKLVDFIGNPTYGNLHMYAMQVLSNCMEDAAIVQMMRESGSLARLTAFVIGKEIFFVSFITSNNSRIYIDQQAPDEEKDDKKKKAKSPKGKREGKAVKHIQLLLAINSHCASF